MLDEKQQATLKHLHDRRDQLEKDLKAYQVRALQTEGRIRNIDAQITELSVAKGSE